MGSTTASGPTTVAQTETLVAPKLIAVWEWSDDGCVRWEHAQVCNASSAIGRLQTLCRECHNEPVRAVWETRLRNQ